jgi:hypothetical protein
MTVESFRKSDWFRFYVERNCFDFWLNGVLTELVISTPIVIKFVTAQDNGLISAILHVYYSFLLDLF